ncbi:MAG: T9SS type A sorting domain-containing protein [Bacteroidia bacterium]
MSPAGDSLKTLLIPYANGYAQLCKLIKVNDTTFVSIGTKKAQSASNELIWYLKFDNNLNILDEKLIGDTTYKHFANHVRKSLQNELLVSGNAAANNGLSGQIMFYRLGLNGDSLQSFYMGDSLFQSGNDMLQLANSSGYLLFGTGFKLPFTGNIDAVQINNLGAVDTIVTINTCQSNYTEITAQWISDSSFAVSNIGGCYLSFAFQLKCQIVDLNYNVLHDTIIGSIDTSEYTGNRSMDFIDSDKIFLGSTYNWNYSWFQPLQAWFRIIKFDNNMQPQWEKLISHNNDYLFLWCVRAAADGGVLLAGTKFNSATSSGQERDIFIVKLDSLGNFTTGINNPITTKVNEVIIYPNPLHDIIHINSTMNFAAIEFFLYDATGREVMDKKFNRDASVTVSQLGEGIYFYKIKDVKGVVVNGKLVKE